MAMFLNVLEIESYILGLLVIAFASAFIILEGCVLLYDVYKHCKDKLLRHNTPINCKNCINYDKCKEMNNSFEFSEYGDKWAQYCEDYLSK